MHVNVFPVPKSKWCYIYITLLFRFEILDRQLNAIRATWTINIAAIRLEVNLSHKLMALRRVSKERRIILVLKVK